MNQPTPWKSLLFAALLVAGLSVPAKAEGRRIALVIANSHYQQISTLQNPQADALALAERLKRAGFTLLRPVRPGSDVQADLTLAEMERADAALKQAAQGAEMVLLFYTGHGLQMDGVPYLVPVELPGIRPETLQSSADAKMLKRQLMELDDWVDGLDRHAQVAIAMFDACREIPQLQESSKAVFGNDSPFKGLTAPKSKGRHRLLAYSASSGEFAKDGRGQPHSPYIQAWLDEFDKNADKKDIISFFSDVAVRVPDAKGQNPELVISGIPSGTYYFGQGGKSAPNPPEPVSVSSPPPLAEPSPPVEAPAPPLSKKAKKGRQQQEPSEAAAEPTFEEPIVSSDAAEPETKSLPPPDSPAMPAIEMVKIPAGKFFMGSDEEEDKADKDEKPRHPVTVRAFRLGKTEVTQAQWKAVMGNNPSKFKDCGDNCPVENVSFDEAQEFIRKLNAETGRHYRLPTEAEWEYACRAGRQSRFCGGDDAEAVAWHGGRHVGNTTHPVARKQANAWDLYDMSGNVSEWTCSAYVDHYGDGSETACAQGDDQVRRGGSWNEDDDDIRPANRDKDDQDDRGDDVGFRLAQDL